LTAYDFGSETVTMESFLQYAMPNIWGSDGTFTYNATTPSASTYTIGDTTHTAVEIFNATWVNNLNDNHAWQLTNTPDTSPAVFILTDIGQNLVSMATNELAGIVKGSVSGHKINGSGEIIHAQGSISKNELDSEVGASLDKANSALQSFTEIDPTVSAWAKATTKPTYTASEVGAMSGDRTITINGETKNIKDNPFFTVEGSGGDNDGGYGNALLIDTQEKFAELVGTNGKNGIMNQPGFPYKTIIFDGINVGDTGFVLDTANTGILIPLTVERLAGVNNAQINITNFTEENVFNYISFTQIFPLFGVVIHSANNGGIYYNQNIIQPKNIDTYVGGPQYKITDLQVNCSGKNGYYGICFSACANLTNCVGNGYATYYYGIGFANCVNLTNCLGNGSGYGSPGSNGNGNGFMQCKNLTNCVGNGKGNTSGSYSGHGIGFSHCAKLTNCLGTGSGYGENNGSKIGYGAGFSACINLTSCLGTGSGYGPSNDVLVGFGAGFYECSKLIYCGGLGTSESNKGYAFYSTDTSTKYSNGIKGLLMCYSLGVNTTGVFSPNCYVELAGGTTAPANTAAGGWNNTTNSEQGV
jgi:hypothetical protein